MAPFPPRLKAESSTEGLSLQSDLSGLPRSRVLGLANLSNWQEPASLQGFHPEQGGIPMARGSWRRLEIHPCRFPNAGCQRPSGSTSQWTYVVGVPPYPVRVRY